jgi:hypothetical protein
MSRCNQADEAENNDKQKEIHGHVKIVKQVSTPYPSHRPPRYHQDGLEV